MRNAVVAPGRTLTIIGQDPSLRDRRGRILTAAVTVPNEDLGAGPRGYRVQVVDYDATTNRMYAPLPRERWGSVAAPRDPYAAHSQRTRATRFNARLLEDPRFHAQNVYAIAMRTLAQFERALGRRLSWSFGGHQLKIAPHAFADANAYYSPNEEALLFGYFAGPRGRPVLTALSHDVVAHETTHALVDGLRPRFMEPSSPDQAAFHEAFADIVALLSVFSIPEMVSYAVRKATVRPVASTLRLSQLTIDALKNGILLGLGEEFGEAYSGVRGASLRRSVSIVPSPRLLNSAGYREEHTRGEILVAAMLHAFLGAYRTRLQTLGRDMSNRFPEQRVAEEGADIAARVLTAAIRALDYTPPTDIGFGDYLSALLTSDLEIHPDDNRFELRRHIRNAFASFGIAPTSSYGGEYGRWEPPLPVRRGGRARPRHQTALDYRFVHRESMMRDRDELFRFLWDNRTALGLCEAAYTEVGTVRPCLRVDQDGFTLRETVADYVQILTVQADELATIPMPGRRQRIRKPKGLEGWRQVRILGGGALLFDEFGHLKYHIRNAILNPVRQTRRLRHLYESGYFDERAAPRSFAGLHMRGMRPDVPAFSREVQPWR